MGVIDDRLEAVYRIAKVLDEFDDSEDIDAIMGSVISLASNLYDEDDDPDDDDRDDIDVDDEDEDEETHDAEIHMLKAV